MRGILGALVAALALTGATWAQSFTPDAAEGPHLPAAQTGDYASIRRIAIVSSLGTELRIDDRKGSKAVDISAWKVDDLVAATLRKYLGGRFEIVVDRRAADATVVVSPVADPTPGPAGIGVHLEKPMALCANYRIEIVDARRGDVLGRAVSRMQMHAALPASFACYAESASLRAGLEPEPQPEALELLHTQLRILLPRSLVESLRALKLPVVLPPPGDHATAPPEDPLDTEGIASVAVVSAIGDRFSFVTPADVLHRQEVVEVAVADSGLDAEAERIAAAALARKFTVKPAAFDRAMLSRVVLQEGKRPSLDGLKPSADVDAYVVIVKAFRAGTGASGPGLWNRDWLRRSTFAFANYAVIVVDARTLKVLRAALPVMSPAASTAYPLMRADGALWPDGAKDGMAAEKARPVIRTLVAGSLPETLYQMGLTNGDAD